MRLDMTTREWHGLIKPVLPHASKDADEPQLGVIRVEPDEVFRVVYAVATDRYTLAAERWHLPDGASIWDALGPVHIRLSDAAASLKLFGYDKDLDPMLKITVDKAPVPVRVAGTAAVINHLSLTVESDDGTRLVMHDQRDPSNDPLGSWRGKLRDAWARPLAAPSALSLSAGHMAKWGSSVRRGERLTIYCGADLRPLLILVENHFAGLWVQARYLDGPDKILAESPWREEVALPDRDVDEATGELLGGGEPDE